MTNETKIAEIKILRASLGVKEGFVPPVPGEGCVMLADVLRQLEEAHLARVPVVMLSLDTLGGDSYGASGLFHALRCFSEGGGKVVAFVAGYAASSAAVYVLGADYVVASPRAKFGLHGNTWLKTSPDGAPQVRDAVDQEEAGLVDELNWLQRLVLEAKTLAPPEKVTRWCGMAGEADILDAERAMSLGFVDLVGDRRDARELAHRLALGKVVRSERQERLEARAASEADGLEVVRGCGALVAERAGGRGLSFLRSVASAPLPGIASDRRAEAPCCHLLSRVEDFARPISTSLDALPKHLTEATKDIAMREALLSVHDILTDGDVRAAMLQTIGEDGIKVLDGWLRDSANDLVIPDGGAGAIINFSNKARTGFTGMVFSFNVAQMLQNFANAANAFDAVPVKFLGSGLARLAKDRSAAIQEMHDLSATMKQRSTSFERDIGDSLRALRGQEGVLARTREVGLWGMQVVDQVVAVPTFWGAFEHAIATKEEGGLGLSKDMAVRHAEQTVRLRMGSGLTKDLSAVMRDPRAKFLTMFMGFANGQLNQLFAAHADASLAWSQGDRYRALRRLTKTYFWVALLGTVASEVFTGRAPKEEDEEGKKRWGKWAVTKAAMAPVMWVPLLSQAAKSAESGRDASLTPYAQLFTTLSKAGVGAWKIGDKEFDALFNEGDEVSVEDLTKAGLNIIEAAASWNGLPVTQTKATAGYWNDPRRDEDASVAADVYGSLYGKKRSGRLNEILFPED